MESDEMTHDAFCDWYMDRLLAPPRARRIEAWDADHTEDAFMRRYAQIQRELRGTDVTLDYSVDAALRAAI